LYFGENGLIRNDCEDKYCPYHKKNLEQGKVIEIAWHDKGNPCWTFETEMPHAKFNIMEDDEIFGEGIVFGLAALRKSVNGK
jgi:hypothetical protein